jgi:hypothetical protein
MVVGAIEICAKTKSVLVRITKVRTTSKNFFMGVVKRAGRNPRRH